MNGGKVSAALMSAYAVDVLFRIVEFKNEVKKSFFPFFDGYDDWDGKMTLSNYVYFYGQHVSICLYFWAAYMASGFRVWNVCLYLELIDIANYALFYNHPKAILFGWAIDYNVLRFTFLLYFCHKEYGQD